jgi:hypothetical protein
MHVKASRLSLMRQVPFLSKKLILTKINLIVVLVDDKPIAPARIEPLDRTTLLGQRSLLSKAPKAQQGHDHACSPSPHRVKIGWRDQKPHSTPPAGDDSPLIQHRSRLQIHSCLPGPLSPLPPRLFEPFAVFVLGHFLLAPFFGICHMLTSFQVYLVYIAQDK